MNEQERDNLLRLHRMAVIAWGAAEHGGTWADAYAADMEFTEAVLMAVPVTL